MVRALGSWRELQREREQVIRVGPVTMQKDKQMLHRLTLRDQRTMWRVGAFNLETTDNVEIRRGLHGRCPAFGSVVEGAPVAPVAPGSVVV